MSLQGTIIAQVQQPKELTKLREGDLLLTALRELWQGSFWHIRPPPHSSTWAGT
jgi:hypothetical protein